jgi:broad specificity phosphatase PhoE
MSEIVVVRHGATEWSRSGQHTGHTDLPLIDDGRDEARTLVEPLSHRDFALVLCSPLSRARETCELAGFGDRAEFRDDLKEWDYGEYEGRTSADVREEVPGWTLWSHGAPGGEDAEAVGARADRVIAELADVEGDALVFAHGHILRVITARWIELEPTEGIRLPLATAAVGVLGHEHGRRALALWNWRPAAGI